MRNLARFAFSIGATALIAGCGAAHMPSATSVATQAAADFSHRVVLRYTGKKQSFKVPAGVTRIRVIALGGNGAGEDVIAHGGRVSAVIPVTPSQTLSIYVGGTARSARSAFNGGGAGGDTTSSSGSDYARYGGGALRTFEPAVTRSRIASSWLAAEVIKTAASSCTARITVDPAGKAAGAPGAPASQVAARVITTYGGGGGGGSSYVENSASEFHM